LRLSKIDRVERQVTPPNADTQLCGSSDSWSAEAAAGDSVQLHPLWIGYRTLAENVGERQLFDFLSGGTRLTAVAQVASGGRVLGERYAVAFPRPFQIDFPAV